MWSDDFELALREARRSIISSEASFGQRLLNDLLERQEELAAVRPTIRPRSRFQLVAAAALVVLIGLTSLGSISSERTIPLGFVLRAEFTPGHDEVPALADWMAFVNTSGAAEELSVSISQDAGRRATLLVIGVAPRTGPQELARALRRHYPVLRAASFEMTDFIGTIEETLLQRFARDLLRLEIDPADPERARETILEQLRLANDERAEVRIEQKERYRRIEVRLERD